MPKVSKKSTPEKPDKPTPDFPLFPHATRRWAKKIRGKLHYFGPWDNPEAALNKYLDERHDLHAGRKPRQASPTGITVRELANKFLTAKKLLTDSGELSPRTFTDYHATCERVIHAFGRERVVSDLAADDFDTLRASIAKVWGPVALSNEITRIRVLFKYASDAGLVEHAVRFGPHFKRPSRKVLRKARQARGPRMFEAGELRALIDAAPAHLRAMILLGINCGFGNSDVATLPLSAVKLKAGWIAYPRPKTSIERRCPLWKETIAAIKAAIAERPEPKDPADAKLLFITKYGQRWHKDTKDNPVSREVGKLIVSAGLKRDGLNFYALRHTFETIGGETGDQVAVDFIMGHSPQSDDMSAAYREKVSDERLKRVTDFVHAWLFARKKSAKRKAK